MNRTAAALAARSAESGVAPTTLVLAVGDARAWVPANQNSPRGASLAFAEFDDVTPELINELEPEIVVSSLLSRSFDCVDLAQRLYECGYRGAYHVLSHNLPEPELVLREIRSLFPTLNVEMDSMPHQMLA